MAPLKLEKVKYQILEICCLVIGKKRMLSCMQLAGNLALKKSIYIIGIFKFAHKGDKTGNEKFLQRSMGF